MKPHKVRYYLERRDPAFEAKMAEVLCVYQEVAILRRREADAAKAAPDLNRGDGQDRAKRRVRLL